MTAHERAAVEPSGDDDSSTRHPGMVRVKVRVRRSRRRRRRIVLAVLLVVVVAGVAMAFLARPLISARNEAKAAQDDLTSAKDALKNDQFERANALVAQARAHVDQAQSDAGGLGGDVWSVVPVAGGAVDDERHLIDALDETTSVAELGVKIYPIVSGRSAELVRGQRIDLELLQDVADRTTAIGPHLDRALSDLEQVSGSTPVVGSTISRAKATALSYLTPLQETYDTNEPILQSMPGLVGADGPRTYLLAMLNPSELRYSGGAALSFTTLRFDHGVASFGSTVNADDLAATGSIPSWPRVPGNWFHPRPTQRVPNSTFSPWWSVSGEELLRGYRAAFPGPPLNGLIAIDLQGLASQFQLTGPINLPPVGQIDADNLVQVLGGSYEAFNSTQQRHQLNAELVPAFQQKFFEGGQMSEKVKALAQSAEGRHFVVYVRNRPVEKNFANAGLTGDLSRTRNDYIGVFSQNLNGSKTDYWQHREVTSTVRLQPDGSAQEHLHVKVSNEAPAYNLPGSDPGTGYDTRFLRAQVGLFFPKRADIQSTRIDNRRADLPAHLPHVPYVLNRKFVQAPLPLQPGQSKTIDAMYRTPHAAEVVDSQTMIYRLDIDPQDLVNAPVYHIKVTWPDGYEPSGSLPAGWKSTSNGATFNGEITTRVAWEIPLTKG